MSSGAIHRVDPANKDVASVSESSSTTVDNPKSEIKAFPSSLMRILVWKGTSVDRDKMALAGKGLRL